LSPYLPPYIEEKIVGPHYEKLGEKIEFGASTEYNHERLLLLMDKVEKEIKGLYEGTYILIYESVCMYECMLLCTCMNMY
jgi:hypothetical protein